MPRDNTALFKYVRDGFSRTKAFQKRPVVAELFREILQAAIDKKPPLTISTLANTDRYLGNTHLLHAHINILRRSLDVMYETDSRSAEYRIKIRCNRSKRPGANAYEIWVEKNNPRILNPLDYFWEKFLRPTASNIVYISEPLSFIKKGAKPDDCAYVRYPKVNTPKDRALLRGVVVDPRCWDPIVYHAKLPELFGLFALLHELAFRGSVASEKGKTARGDSVVASPARFCAYLTTPSMVPKPDARTNLIVFGNPQINLIFGQQQASIEPQLYLSPIDSKVHDRSNPSHRYRDSVTHGVDQLLREKFQEITTYGLLTYKHTSVKGVGGQDIGRTVLLIGGNFGPAMLGICQYITEIDCLRNILCPLLTIRHKLADSFQVLFKVSATVRQSGYITTGDTTIERVIVEGKEVPLQDVSRSRERIQPRAV